MNQTLCLCYHPTTTVLVDDNQDFLEAISIELEPAVCCQTYTDPGKALHFFQHDYKLEPFTQRCFINSSEERLDHLFVDIDLRQIHKEKDDPGRFAEVAVVIVDYTMPRMNGLSLASEIKALLPNIKLILLTGDADHDIAVQAFNDGLIDKFIKKSTPDLSLVLVEAIKTLEHKYFLGLSQSILNKLRGNSEKLARLHEPEVVEFFAELCQQRNTVEYYLVDSSGSFLLINKQGEPTWLVLLTTEELEELYQFAHIEKAPAAVLHALQQKTKLPFFYTEQDLTTPPLMWEKYLHTAQRLKNSNYYYAVTCDTQLYHWPKFTCYQQFRLALS